MEEREIIGIIKPLLNNYGIEEFDALKPQTQRRLVMMEKYFQKCIEKYANIKQNIRHLDLSVRGICKGSNVGKTTVYNNPDILKKYIEKRINDIECNVLIIPKLEFNTLVNKVELLQSNLNKMLVDIARFENMRVKVKSLEKIIANLEVQKIALQHELNKSEAEKDELQREFIRKKSKIVSIYK
ncbi:hypothetical protein [Clostridium kluyveri]|uniref:Uncharacterized protein n=2 Tax=Clostridium kluyveri TaxID=1534 RepID=A5N8Y7_CLOK5|nr:hypothetical protein [Clostridium kluyveri]EDK33768.1 Conserved hypothetical protein [Clostridium kluyveri DSM 555]BAH06651.1 hypothetical protein CKR_1600 [Clostridium kluyveri NBRC 12016]